jgi:hypothetical protein
MRKSHTPLHPHLLRRFLSESEPESHSFVSAEQLILHVLAYAEVLFRWKLLHKRIELLKAVDPFLRSLRDPSLLDVDHSELGTPFYIRLPRFLIVKIGVSILCAQCGGLTASRTQSQSSCSTCGTRLGMPRCSICRLPVKGTLLVSSVPASFSLTQRPLLRSLLPLLGMSSRQPSILLEVASERHLYNWLFMPLPCYGSSLDV